MNDLKMSIVIVSSTLALLSLFFAWVSEEQWKYELIQRGYAQYCPVSGEFAYIGECDQ